MLLLLDTHTFLWFVWGDPQLSATARLAIEDSANTKYVSIASIWEMAIKVSIGKLTLAKPIALFLAEHLDGNGFETLAVERSHAERMATLPFYHRDPFDRLLAVQCQVERMALISTDTIFDAYGLQRLW